MSWTPTPLLPSPLSPSPERKKNKKAADAMLRCARARARSPSHKQAPPTWVGERERESARADKANNKRAPPTWVGAGHWCVALADLAHTHSLTHTGARHGRETRAPQPPPPKKKTFIKARQSVQRLITRQPSSRTATPKRAPPKGAPHTHTPTHRTRQRPNQNQGKTSARLRAIGELGLGWFRSSPPPPPPPPFEPPRRFGS